MTILIVILLALIVALLFIGAVRESEIQRLRNENASLRASPYSAMYGGGWPRGQWHDAGGLKRPPPQPPSW